MTQNLSGYTEETIFAPGEDAGGQAPAGSLMEDFLSGRTGLTLGFDSTNQIMVDLWSEGFQLGTLPEANKTDGLGRYCQAREQLAAYMREQILQEYISFGCAPAVCRWYDAALTARREQVIDLAARSVAARRGKLEKPGTGFVPMDNYLLSRYCVVVDQAWEAERGSAAAKEAPATFGSLHMSPAVNDYVCAVTGEAGTIVVKFGLTRWEDMELMLGTELPKILKGWRRYRLPAKHRSKARYDAVGMVGTPIEHCVQAYFLENAEASEAKGLNLTQETQYLAAFNPNISIAFSEKGIQKIWKKLNI